MKKMLAVIFSIIVFSGLYVALSGATVHASPAPGTRIYWNQNINWGEWSCGQEWASYTYDPTHTGYFSGAKGSAPCNVLPAGTVYDALTSVTDAASFIRVISTDLNGQNPAYPCPPGACNYTDGGFMNKVGAAFIVDSMLGIGQSGGLNNGINLARSNFSDWTNRVNQLANANEVNWFYKPATSSQYCSSHGSYIHTSTYSPDISDDVYWNEPCGNNYNDSMPEIVFSWPGGSFEIGKQCGNVQNGKTPNSPLPPVNHQPYGTLTLACSNKVTGQFSATATFGDPDAGTTAYLSAGGTNYSVQYNIPFPIPTSSTSPYSPEVITLYAYDTGPAGSQQPVAVASASTQPLLPCASFGCGGVLSTPSSLDQYTQYGLKVSATVSQPPPNPTMDMAVVTPANVVYYRSGQISTTGSSPLYASFNNIPQTNSVGVFTAVWHLYSNGTLLEQCTGNFSVVYLPYLNVYGGDVMTGAAPAAGAACSINNFAGAYSWNQYGAGYAGAGSEYAVQALAQIEEFGSAMNPSSSSPPIGLSFANSAIAAGKVSPSQGLYGGFFGDSSGAWACGTDYTKGLSPISGAAATTQIANLPPTPGDAQINDGQQLRIYATGDVYISRNIAYQPGAWPQVDQIPFFELVVTGGNIYIDSSVTHLDGIYIAEPSGAAGGQIIDCATNAGGILKQVDPTVNGFYSTCNKQLVINGAFVAKQVLFGRTNGSLGQATAGDSLGSNHDAEIFNYTPEIWLPRNTATPSDTYDAITALPPVL